MDKDDLPVIIGQTGPLNGQRWVVEKSILIGRDADCDIVIPDRQVSRYHTRITNLGDSVSIEDLASKNGTFSNGMPVEGSVLLQDGDLIQIALIQQFVFLSSDTTMPLDFELEDIGQLRRGITMDKRSRRVWIDHIEVMPPLSPPQFTLLETLFDNQGKVVSRNDLILTVWGEEEAIAISEQALDALVRRLRDRLASVDPDHSYISTIRGHGLRLDNPE
jgi:hypothetical protein